jgi:hypothetical protein
MSRSGHHDRLSLRHAHPEFELHFHHSGIAFTVMAEHQGW